MTSVRRVALRRRPLGLLAFLLVLISVPAWAPNRFWINVASQALIFAIFAMSLDLLLGYGGMPSFGHAAFYAAGAYGCASGRCIEVRIWCHFSSLGWRRVRAWRSLGRSHYGHAASSS
jgi:ABC-type branched-subunit amino acid transport system permease subunit